eukprot:COSAG01_NODE_16516_length_1230_cov_1.320071_1_plen_198_part_00
MDETTGSGGCTAHALSKLRVFASDVVAKQKLNAQLNVVLEKRRSEVRAEYPAEKVGIRDEEWCMEVIKLAVTAAGFDFEKLDLSACNLKEELKRGKHLIDGIQNREWLRDKHTYVNDPDDEGEGPETAAGRNRWRHSIAVSGGRVLEQNDDRFGMKWLWIGDGNKPDTSKGYMREILKVFKITKRDEPAAKRARTSA